MRSSPRHRVLIASAVAVLAGACAEVNRMGPRGGPEDHAPPVLVKVTPDTGRLNTKPKDVVFRYDEVVSERPSGANDLAALVILSPSDGVPRVSWHRQAISVRPRRGFRANTAYSVTIRPGMADLRGNVSKTAVTTYFSTGGEIPRTTLRGVVFDWVAGKPVANALVQAFRRGDTTISWIATTDSIGRFVIRAFPSGSYLVRGMIDANSNRALDPREAYDTVGAAIADSATIELLAFVHDSLGPRIDRLTLEDSITLRVDFDQPVDPRQPLTRASFTLLRADSSAIPILALLTDSALTAEKSAAALARGDSAAARAAARLDSARQRPAPNVPRPSSGSAVPLPARGQPAAATRDTTPLPRPSRPSPESRTIIRIGAPLTPGSSYRLRAIDVRGIASQPRTSDRVFSAPRAAPPAARDSSAARRPPNGAPAPVPAPAGKPPVTPRP